MELYKSGQEFHDAITAASNYYRISPSIVEKDYFVTVILRELNKVIPGILFKGGTSLSKCFNVIKRFSEDIDLTLDTSHFTQSNKRNANRSVIAVCDKLGFQIQNRSDVECHTHGNYNCYNIEYPVSFSNYSVKPFIKLEMTFIQKSYPDTVKPVISLIGEYLVSIGQTEALPVFDLEPFGIKVQSLERTFVDKVFALCDYYLNNQEIRQSRHIYDLNRLMQVIDWKSLNSLVDEVRKDRMPNRTSLSAQPDVSVREVLNLIIKSEYFRKDYENVTATLLSEPVNYSTAIHSIEEIASDPLFDK